MMTASFTSIAGALLLLGATAEACTIPVFRYALDRWKADSFGVVVGENWRTNDMGRTVGEAINVTKANLAWVDPEGASTDITLMWPGAKGVFWRGMPEAEEVDAILRSPLRAEIAKRILSGDSAVWVLVESGDTGKDEAFAKRLEARLEYLQSVAAIPPQDSNDPDSKLGPGPELKVGFSMLRVRRDDPKERFVVKMLAGPEGQELLDGKVPFASPVFARGRVLGAWSEEFLDDAGIDETCLFLLGACSCRVKALNPGWDLLMTVDWDTGLMAAAMAKDAEDARREHDETPETEPE